MTRAKTQRRQENKTRFSSHCRAQKQFKRMGQGVLVLTGEAETIYGFFASWRLDARMLLLGFKSC
jgi:hypothetical protein